MAFGQFKNKASVLEKFSIRYEEGEFVVPTEFVISQAFIDDFNFVRDHIDTRVSESSICENIIYPILKEVYKKYAEDFALWSHKVVEYDSELTGTPDYLVATKSELGKIVLGRPLLMVVEAKKNDFEEGWGQCLAEMVMAQKINGAPSFTIYGIVSDGDVWEFGKLLENDFTLNRDLFTLSEIERLFGAVDFVLGSLRQALSTTRAAKQ